MLLEKMSVDINTTPHLLLLIQQKLRIVQYRYGSFSPLGSEISTKSIPPFSFIQQIKQLCTEKVRKDCKSTVKNIQPDF